MINTKMVVSTGIGVAVGMVGYDLLVRTGVIKAITG